MTQEIGENDLKYKQNEALLELNYLNKDIPLLENDIVSANNEIASIIQNLNLEINQYKDLKIVQDHRAIYAQ